MVKFVLGDANHLIVNVITWSWRFPRR